MTHRQVLSVGMLCIAFLFGVESHAATLRIRAVPLALDTEARKAQLHPHFGPKTQAFIAEEARRELTARAISIEAVQLAVVRADLGTNGPGDIEAVMEAVMFQLAADAEDELRDQLAEMQKALAAKTAERDKIAKLKAADSKIDSQASKEFSGLRSSRRIAPGYTLDQYMGGRRASVADTDRQLQAQLDSMGDMGETDQLRLQQLMDQRAKALETISNLMKKQSDTNQAIVGNLK
jgi:hypothetical protein